MGVYINMEMPKQKATITIFSDGRVYENYGDRLWGHGKDCIPWRSVPVPPHGRLIDGDKQDVQIEALIERHLHGYTKSTWDFVCELRDILKRNRTVIPADQAEEA